MPNSLTSEKPVPRAKASFAARRPVKLLGRILPLAAAMLLFLVCFEFRYAAFNPSHYGAKRRLLDRQAPHIEVLTLGSSHAFSGLDPTVLHPAAFNLAFVSQSLFYDCALVHKFLPSLPALKLVIVPIDYLSLEYELDDGGEPWRAYYYYYFYSLRHRDWHKAWSMRNYSAYFLCNEADRARVLFGRCADARSEYDEWGAFKWELGTNWSRRAELPPAPATAGYLRQKALEALARHAAAMKSRNLPVNTARLQELVHELQARGVGVLFVSFPVSRFYREGMAPETYRRMQAAIAQLTRNQQAAYKNYIFDPRFTDLDFADGDHLNCYGAQRFSRILKEDLRGLAPQLAEPNQAPIPHLSATAANH